MDSFDKLTITFGLRFFSVWQLSLLLPTPRYPPFYLPKKKKAVFWKQTRSKWMSGVAVVNSLPVTSTSSTRHRISNRGLNQFSNLLCIRSNCLSSAYSDCSFTILKEKSDLAIWNVSLKHMVTKDENLNFENSKVERKVCRIERLMMYRKCSQLGGKQCAVHVQRICNAVYG